MKLRERGKKKTHGGLGRKWIGQGSIGIVFSRRCTDADFNRLTSTRREKCGASISLSLPFVQSIGFASSSSIPFSPFFSLDIPPSIHPFFFYLDDGKLMMKNQLPIDQPFPFFPLTDQSTKYEILKILAMIYFSQFSVLSLFFLLKRPILGHWSPGFGGHTDNHHLLGCNVSSSIRVSMRKTKEGRLRDLFESRRTCRGDGPNKWTRDEIKWIRERKRKRETESFFFLPLFPCCST